MKVLNQQLQGGFLSWSTGVGGMAVGIESSLVAHSDTVAVVTFYMGADHGFRAALVEGAIALHVVVVTDVFPSTVVHVVVAALLESIAASEQCCTTV